MHQRTDLASGLINGSDRLLVELIQPIDTPAARGDSSSGHDRSYSLVVPLCRFLIHDPVP
jgi:hypothetical protein